MDDPHRRILGTGAKRESYVSVAVHPPNPSTVSHNDTIMGWKRSRSPVNVRSERFGYGQPHSPSLSPSRKASRTHRSRSRSLSPPWRRLVSIPNPSLKLEGEERQTNWQASRRNIEKDVKLTEGGDKGNMSSSSSYLETYGGSSKDDNVDYLRRLFGGEVSPALQSLLSQILAQVIPEKSSVSESWSRTNKRDDGSSTHYAAEPERWRQDSSFKPEIPVVSNDQSRQQIPITKPEAEYETDIAFLRSILDRVMSKKTTIPEEKTTANTGQSQKPLVDYTDEMQLKEKIISMLYSQHGRASDISGYENLRKDERFRAFGSNDNASTYRSAQQERAENFLTSIGLLMNSGQQSAASSAALPRELARKAADAARMLANYFRRLYQEADETSDVTRKHKPLLGSPVEAASTSAGCSSGGRRTLLGVGKAHSDESFQYFPRTQGGNPSTSESSFQMRPTNYFNRNLAFEYESQASRMAPSESRRGRTDDFGKLYPDDRRPKVILDDSESRYGPGDSEGYFGAERAQGQSNSCPDTAALIRDYTYWISQPIPFGIGRESLMSCDVTLAHLQEFYYNGTANIDFFDAVACLFMGLIKRTWFPKITFFTGVKAPPLPMQGESASLFLLIVGTFVVVVRWGRQLVLVRIPREHLRDTVRAWCVEQLAALRKQEGETWPGKVSVSLFPDDRLAPMEYHILEALRLLTLCRKKEVDVMRWCDEENRRELVEALRNFIGIR